jgi:hypothetical protein
MEPKTYDRLADLLTQIHRKIANNAVPDTLAGIDIKETTLSHIERAMTYLDLMGKYDGKGLL